MIKLRKEIRIIRIILSEMICFFTVTIQRIIFLSRLRREILQINTNQTNIILKIIERFEKILIDLFDL